MRPIATGAFFGLCLPLMAQLGGAGGNGIGAPRTNAGRTAGARTTFITGSLFLEDGAAIPAMIAIVGGCRGPMQLLGYADMRGHFSLDLKGGTSTVDDAASPSSRNSSVCEIAARLEGYRSTVVDLSQRVGMDNPDIGTILLHRIGEQEGSTVSLTSLQAPKGAKKAFEKGLDLERKHRLDEAAAQFAKATAMYPRYADAWYRLGHVQVERNALEASREFFGKAIAADAKLVPPYVELAALDVNAGRWKQALENSQRAIKLDPFGFPGVYYFDAVARFNVQDLEGAERSARELQRIDTQNRFVRSYRILAAVLEARKDYAGAADTLRGYLRVAPEAKDAAEVRAQVGELERRQPVLRNEPNFE
jgi:tetratricopeptide (TPR) repeat protein